MLLRLDIQIVESSTWFAGLCGTCNVRAGPKDNCRSSQHGNFKKRHCGSDTFDKLLQRSQRKFVVLQDLLFSCQAERLCELFMVRGPKWDAPRRARNAYLSDL